MSLHRILELLAAASALAIAGAATAQEAEIEQKTLTDLIEEMTVEQETSATDESAPEAESGELNEDEMAAYLNSQQVIRKTITLERKIDGVVVEKDVRSVVIPTGSVYEATEAGGTTLEKVKASFDGEVLTRGEAYEEAQLDFTLADVNHDGLMSEDEYAALVTNWWKDETRQPGTIDEATARQRQYDAFLSEISDDYQPAFEEYARKKFIFMTGGHPTLARQSYIDEYLIDFFAMDEDKDLILRGNELMRFRALNRGDSIGD